MSQLWLFEHETWPSAPETGTAIVALRQMSIDRWSRKGLNYLAQENLKHRTCRREIPNETTVGNGFASVPRNNRKPVTNDPLVCRYSMRPSWGNQGYYASRIRGMLPTCWHLFLATQDLLTRRWQMVDVLLVNTCLRVLGMLRNGAWNRDCRRKCLSSYCYVSFVINL